MVMRQFCLSEYEALCKQLAASNPNPLDASITVPLVVDNCQYRLRLQTCSRRRVAVLQAIKEVPGNGMIPTPKLITENILLFSLLELYLQQSK